MFTDDRNAYRNAFYMSWQKHLQNIPLQAQEAKLVQVILLHPEYQSLLNQTQTTLNNEYLLEENPYLHMSLHLAVQEQVELDRPVGIKKIYQTLLQHSSNFHHAEHQMMDCLAKIIWQAQNTGELPNETQYLQLLNEI